jgi:hypothetical protein
LLEIAPDNSEVRIALGLSYYDMKNFDPVIDKFLKVLEKNISYDRTRYLLATTYEEKITMIRHQMNIANYNLPPNYTPMPEFTSA